LTAKLGLSTRIRRSPDAASRVVAGETLVLDLRLNRFFSLDPVGTRVWELLSEESTYGEVLGTMLAEFDVEEERLTRDLQHLFHELAERLLIRLDGSSR
jgi:hypothetical protein